MCAKNVGCDTLKNLFSQSAACATVYTIFDNGLTLSTTIVIFILFYFPVKSLLFGTKCASKHQDLQMFGLKFNEYQ